jgi:hypothetical protein
MALAWNDGSPWELFIRIPESPASKSAPISSIEAGPMVASISVAGAAPGFPGPVIFSP